MSRWGKDAERSIGHPGRSPMSGEGLYRIAGAVALRCQSSAALACYVALVPASSHQMA